ncbi:putative sterigmatocystin biosynthesis monooxygenase stcW [Penicillium rolfsii]|nr:putative sterigmatocystin biosynthesis monooxygenase stcW [Penicillium rolfsii]
MAPLVTSSDRPLHANRHLRVVCIGAGASGIYLAYRLKKLFTDYTLNVYEKNSGIGGTWWENRYPGCACDVPAHNYTFSFEPKWNWSSTYASAAEICDYLSDFVDKYDLRSYIHCQHKVVGAHWDELQTEWVVQVQTASQSIIVRRCDFLIGATGILNAWHWPDIPGLEAFKGKLVHSARWNSDIELTGKRVGIIGNGRAEHVTTFFRQASWVCEMPGTEYRSYSAEEQQAFRDTPGLLLSMRKQVGAALDSLFPLMIRDSVAQTETCRLAREQMEQRIADERLARTLIPNYPLGCRRITPGPGYLEALRQPNVTALIGEISQVTASGCVVDGVEHPLDVLICATGFDTSFQPRFPVIGRDYTNLAEEWIDEPRSYLGVAVNKYPNFFTFLGPNSFFAGGSIMFIIELQGSYMMEILNRWQKEGICTFEPKKDAVDDFIEYKDRVMQNTVWTTACRSWHKSAKGQIIGLWPGSPLHCMEVLASPRYDDYHVTYVGQNRFEYLGNGLSQIELNSFADPTYYLRENDDGISVFHIPQMSRRRRVYLENEVEKRSNSSKGRGNKLIRGGITEASRGEEIRRRIAAEYLLLHIPRSLFSQRYTFNMTLLLTYLMSGLVLPNNMVTIYAVLGLFFHFLIQKITLDFHVHLFIAGCALSWAISVAAYFAFTPFGFFPAMIKSTSNATSFSFGLAISIVTYRLFFHRLHSFPGPWGAKVSRFYLAARIFHSLQYHFVLDDWHRQYGDFVRTGPREISISRVSAVRAVHGPTSPCVKAAWYAHVSNDVKNVSIHMTRDLEVHRLRRRAWDRGFSTKSVLSYEPLITAKADMLLAQIQHHMGQSGSVEVTRWMSFFSFDLMGLIGFGKDFHQIESAVEHPAIQRLHSSLDVVARISPLPWMLGLISSIPFMMGNYSEFIDYCTDQVEERRKRWNSESRARPTDIVSWLLKAIDDDDASAPPGTQALHEDGRLMVIAGSTLSNALYYLASHPSAYRELQLHIDKFTPSCCKSHASCKAFNANEVSRIPYLDAVIKETMRLKPASPSGQPRQTPPEGLWVDEVWIPGDVTVTVPQHTIQRDERYFTRANEFLPERWMETGLAMALEDAFFPFGIGPLSCVGKRLAMIEMQVVLSTIARNFDLELAPGENGEAFDRLVKDTVTLSVPPLQLVFRDRHKVHEEKQCGDSMYCQQTT